MVAEPAATRTEAVLKPTSQPTPRFTDLPPTPTIAPNVFLDTFDGDPSSPLPFSADKWDVAVHTRNMDTLYSLAPMAAAHSPSCEPPPETHPIDSYEEAVYQCRDHIMTAIDDDSYGVITLTPNGLVDFSNEEAVVRFDMSTLRTSGRDWISVWVTPFENNLIHPIHVAPDLQGHAKEAVLLEMQIGGNTFLPSIVRGSVVENFPYGTEGVNWYTGYEEVLEPSPKKRETFELRISASHIKFGLPEYDLYWVDIPIDPPLTWTQGVLQLSHHSYTPEKFCDDDGTCGPNTWHWDNVYIAPSIPFEMMRADRRYAEEDNSVVRFAAPTPPGSYMRFSGIGTAIEVSFDQGATWEIASRQAQEDNIEDHFSAYWMPVPTGVLNIYFRGVNWWGGPWHVRDISIWSRN